MKNLLIILSLLVFACSPQRRLNRLEKSHPGLFKVDTIWRVDTIRFEGTKFDTIMQSVITKDTVVITKDNVVIRYFNDGKKVYIQGETKTIDRIIKIPVQVKAPIITKTINKTPWWIYLMIVGLFVIIIGLIFKRGSAISVSVERQNNKQNLQSEPPKPDNIS